ncbi:hypothetical protein [Reichenbachiella sp.]|uniref:hypothetical protein n=1 Tax=Reichenbachiella sp. TaxID=2184521 RepID=UPI00329A2B7E
MEAINEKLKESLEANLNSECAFLSTRQVLLLLDTSDFTLRTYVKDGLLKKYYLRKDKNGKPTGRPWYMKSEIAELLNYAETKTDTK